MLVEFNDHGVRLYWTGTRWLLDAMGLKKDLGQLPAEDAISMFDLATRAAMSAKAGHG